MNELVVRFLEDLARRNHVDPRGIAGLNIEVINGWELTHGLCIPAIYKDYLVALGPSVERLCFPSIDGNVSSWADFERLRRIGNEILEWDDANFRLSEDSFVITIYQTESFFFIVADENDDPPVYRYDGGDMDFYVAFASFSEYLLDLLRAHPKTLLPISPNPGFYLPCLGCVTGFWDRLLVKHGKGN